MGSNRRPLLASPLALGAALFGAALLARLYRLDAQSLWLDEGSSWELSRQGWGALLGDLLRPSAAYPLYHLLLKGWTALFGDSELALRLPSALAGALAVPAIYQAALEVEALGGRTPRRGVSLYGLAAALVALASPYTIWYGQEAKVYSLLLLAASLAVWALARALRTGARADWLAALAVGATGLFVHRLMALLVVAGVVVWAVSPRAGAGPFGRRGAGTPAYPYRRWWALALAALLAALLVAAMRGGLGGDGAAGRSAAGAAIPAGPALALGLTFVRFSVDRWPGDAPWWWLAPWAALLVWGLGRALVDLRPALDAGQPTEDPFRLARTNGRVPGHWSPSVERGRWAERAGQTRDEPAGPTRRAAFLLLMAGVPVGLFLAQLVFTRLYEARYLMVVYPLWALLLAYPLARGEGREAGKGQAHDKEPRAALRPADWAFGAVWAGALLTGGLALFQPSFGLFSGDPVKEQYREAIGELAARFHPDDAVVLHPSYLSPLYRYYMGRLTADPAPEPLLFGDFWQGETDYGQREWDIERRARLAGYTRSFLLIAPDHARTVDRPQPGDEYGLVGNFWAFSREQRAWPCGIWRFNGVHLLCQEAPEPYYTGAPAPEPATPSAATFGEDLRLLGFTLKATTPEGPGVYRAGGSVPISLFWDVAKPLAVDYSLFLHLCQRCDVPPVAGEDGPPLEGYLPTSTWLPGKPARDDRAIALPADMPPGRYTLLLGLYDPADPSEAGRLTVAGGERLGQDRLILGTVEVVAAEGPAAGGGAQP